MPNVLPASEILEHAMALPPNERVDVAISLLQSFPVRAPVVYETEAQLFDELNRRMEALESGAMKTYSAEETIRRARVILEANRRG